MVCGNHFEGGRLTNHRDRTATIYYYDQEPALCCCKRQRSTWQRYRDDLELHR